MARMTGGEAVVAALLHVGIDTVFGIPGVHSGGLYDALYGEASIRHVMSRHEQGAAFMADGYARASGRIACLSTITGPGVTNAATALGEAQADSSPILHIATALETTKAEGETGELHELRNQSGVLKSVVGHHQIVRTIEEIGPAILDAVHHMQTSRPCPASIEIPLNLLTESADLGLLDGPAAQPMIPSASCIADAAQMLSNASAPFIYVGSGGMDASPELVALAEQLQAPVLTAYTGKGAFPESHPLSLGCKMRRDENSYAFLRSRDVALVVGCRLSGRTLDHGHLPIPDRLIQIDIDASSIGIARPVAVGIHADASIALAALMEELPETPPTRDLSDIQAVRENDGYKFSAQESPDIHAALRSVMPADGMLVNDMTMVSYDAPQYFPVDQPRTFMFPNYFGTLGFSLPAAIGAQVACPDRTIVSISGDGGFLFTSEELSTAVREQLPVIVIIADDGMYTAIDRHQRDTFQERTMDMHLTNPDFIKLGEAYGIPSVSVSSPMQLASTVRAAVGRDGPSLIVYQLESSPKAQ